MKRSDFLLVLSLSICVCVIYVTACRTIRARATLDTLAFASEWREGPRTVKGKKSTLMRLSGVSIINHARHSIIYILIYMNLFVPTATTYLLFLSQSNSLPHIASIKPSLNYSINTCIHEFIIRATPFLCYPNPQIAVLTICVIWRRTAQARDR